MTKLAGMDLNASGSRRVAEFSLKDGIVRMRRTCVVSRFPRVECILSKSARRIVDQEFALHKGRFFFLSLRLRRRRKKNDTKLILIHFDAQDRSGGVLHPCTCHLLESDRLLFSQRFLSPDRIN